MMYHQILSAFYSSTWAILPEKLADMRSFLRLKANGGEVSAEDVRTIMAARRPDGVQMFGRVAVLPVFGVISQRVGLMEEASGGISTEKIGATLDSLVADNQVKAILMAFDSPGGSVAGVPELAAKIRTARDQKKVVAFADPMAASAAYWLASQASEIVVTPSGQIGSIGVISGHDDITAALERIGIKATLVTSAPYKSEGYPEVPLTDEARAAMQEKVNHYHGMFVADIAKGRGVKASAVEKDFGQGRMITAQDAVSRGMADKIGTLEQTLKRLGADGSPASIVVESITPKLTAYRARAVEILE